MTGSKSSHRRCSIKKPVLKNFAILYLEFLFNKFLGLEVCDFIKRRLQLSCFPLNIAKFLRTPILKNICERLLLRFLKPTSCLFLYPVKTSKNEGFRYFQWVYKWPIAQNELIRPCIKGKQYLSAFLLIRLLYPTKWTLKT